MSRIQKKLTLPLFLLLSNWFGELASASDAVQKLNLVCEIKSTLVERTMKTEPTIGSNVYQITEYKDQSAVLTRDDLRYSIIGSVNDTTIYGEVKYAAGEVEIQERITISRFTGDYEQFMNFIRKDQTSSFLIHYGKCEKAKAKF